MRVTSKTCTKCGETKALSEFGKHKGSKDGLRPSCKPCHRKANAVYYESNRENVLESKREYYESNREKIREKKRKYREENRDKILDSNRKYRANNPARSHMNGAITRIREYGLVPEPTAEAREESLRHREATLNNPCFFCGSEVTDTWDHLIPLSRGGNDAPSNLARVCRPCNSVKMTKTAHEFRVWVYEQTSETGASSYDFVRSRCELESYAERSTRLINTSTPEFELTS